jgi:hypothetical protein
MDRRGIERVARGGEGLGPVLAGQMRFDWSAPTRLLTARAHLWRHARNPITACPAEFQPSGILVSDDVLVGPGWPEREG